MFNCNDALFVQHLQHYDFGMVYSTNCQYCYKNGKESKEEVYRLQYIQEGPLSTAELSLGGQKEILHFVQLCRKQYGYARKLSNTTDNQKFEDLYRKLEPHELITDHVEFEIAKYLNNLSEGVLSDESARRQLSYV